MSVSAFVCADWGKKVTKRIAFVAEPKTRRVRLLKATPTFAGMVTASRAFASNGAVILGFDVPIGLPASFPVGKHSTFPRFLSAQCPAFFHAGPSARAWSAQRPFFSVPGGAGALSEFYVAAQKLGIDLRREIERLTSGKSLFITSGIPGSVGSSVCALWPEIADALGAGAAFSLWPFDGELPVLISKPGVVVAEIYPRAAYATALLDGSPALRPQMSLAKTRKSVRSAALAQLEKSQWVVGGKVVLENIDEAKASEDHFDALITAAALLRCEIEGLPLHGKLASPLIEGGILGTGSVNLALATIAFSGKATTPKAAPPKPHAPASNAALPCPVPNCTKVFVGSRGGWDAHVASPSRHRAWHPAVTDAEQRKALFRDEFPNFFK